MARMNVENDIAKEIRTSATMWLNALDSKVHFRTVETKAMILAKIEDYYNDKVPEISVKIKCKVNGNNQDVPLSPPNFECVTA